MSNSTTFGDTITGGIQDISALLPLLGTEQCEQHVGSALEKGFLYSSVTPISIFGSLGIVRASSKILLASFSIQNRHLGAKALSDGGLGLSGNVASIIGIDPKHPEKLLAETKLEAMLAEECIENVLDLTVSSGEVHGPWNIKLVIATLFISLSGLLPYINIIHNLRTVHPKDFFPLGLGFPILRVFGSAFCVILVQLLIQVRVLNVMNPTLLTRRRNRVSQEFERYQKEERTSIPSERIQRLSEDLGSKREEGNRWRHLQSQIALPFLCLALAACCISTITGYIGCFFLIQHSGSPTGTLIWLGLEAALSAVRFIIWAINPSWDDPLGILFHVKNYSRDPPIITCKEYVDDIKSGGVEVPLMQRSTFLEEVIPYTGLLQSDVELARDVQLYYIVAACNDRMEDKCLIIVIHALNQPQQARMLLKMEKNREFRIFISSLHSVLGTPVTNVRAEKETERDSHFLTANNAFMISLGKHYDKIQDEIRRGPMSMVNTIYLRRTWFMQQLQPLVVKKQGDSGDKSHSLFSSGEKAYYSHRLLEQHRRDICRLFENWIDIQVNLYKTAARDYVQTAGDYTSDTIEKEFLRLEFRRYLELTLLCYCVKWDEDLGRKHREVVAAILECMDGQSVSDCIRQIRLERRLTNELEFFLDHEAATRRNNMQARISAHQGEVYATVSKEFHQPGFDELMACINDALNPFWRRGQSAPDFPILIRNRRNTFKEGISSRHKGYIGGYQNRADELFDMLDATHRDLYGLLSEPAAERPADRLFCDISTFRQMLNGISEKWRNHRAEAEKWRQVLKPPSRRFM